MSVKLKTASQIDYSADTEHRQTELRSRRWNTNCWGKRALREIPNVFWVKIG